MTGEELQLQRSSEEHNDISGPNRVGSSLNDAVSAKNWRSGFRKRISAHGMSDPYTREKLIFVTNEMKRMNLDILGISELRWTGSGYLDHNSFRITSPDRATPETTEYQLSAARAQ